MAAPVVAQPAAAPVAAPVAATMGATAGPPTAALDFGLFDINSDLGPMALDFDLFSINFDSPEPEPALRFRSSGPLRFEALEFMPSAIARVAAAEHDELLALELHAKDAPTGDLIRGRYYELLGRQEEAAREERFLQFLLISPCSHFPSKHTHFFAP